MNNTFARLLRWAAFGLVSTVLAACGGGGGGGGEAPPPATYTISGAVSGNAGAGVTINLSGAGTATTTTAADGSYSFAGLANGSYTVTPALAGNAFNPSSSAVNVSGANVTGRNFVASAATVTYSISGTVSGAATSGVTLTLTGANTASAVSGTGGAYTLAGLVPGSYTVTPSLAGFTFTPANLAVVIGSANSTGTDFVVAAVAVPHSISGNVGGATAAGVTITVTGDASPTPVSTDANGNYTVSGLFNGNYTVTPSKTGFAFTPTSLAVAMAGADLTGRNFTAAASTVPTYTLSGTVSGPHLEGVQGVRITLNTGASTTTGDTGNYSFANLPAGSYTVTPSLAGYAYTPGAPTVAVNADTTRNFTASSVVPSYSVSGTVSYGGTQVAGVTVSAFPCVAPVQCSSEGSTSIAAPGTGAYAIRGLRGNATYELRAAMAVHGQGAPNANNPSGNASISIGNADATAVAITLADPNAPSATTPTGLTAFPYNGGMGIEWNTTINASAVETATAYKIYWGTDSGASNGSGSPIVVPARSDAIYLQSGLTDGTPYYYRVSAMVGDTESPISQPAGPFTPGAASGLNTVSGTVTFSGTPGGAMYVFVSDDSNPPRVQRIANPVSPQAYSITGVANGGYFMGAFIDANDNGYPEDDFGTDEVTITVTGPLTRNLTIGAPSNAVVGVRTQHFKSNGTGASSYSIFPEVGNGIKRVVKATLVSGQHVAVPHDLGRDGDSFRTFDFIGANVPLVGDVYRFRLTYSDGTTETVDRAVTAVLNNFAQNLTAVTDGTGGSSPAVPLFTWSAPIPAPGFGYSYSAGVFGSVNWFSDFLGSNVTQVLFNADGRASAPSLPAGSHNWNVSVRDAAGNMATSGAVYTRP
jgi:Carboxypeptidase regulatory-like domain